MSNKDILENIDIDNIIEQSFEFFVCRHFCVGVKNQPLFNREHDL